MGLKEAAQQALDALERADKISGCGNNRKAITALRAALAEDAMQRLTDVQQEMDCYGDGNVYRGQRSSDSKTPTLTSNGMPAVEGPLSKSHRTCQESRQVEPVAYVTGYSKGYATVRPIDPCLLMPVGMALYRSPPTINKMETVEPVAWAVITKGGKLYKAASTKESAERKARQQIDKLGVEWECSVVPLYLSPTAVKMVATINKTETVEPVAWMHEWEGVATLNMTPPNYYGDHWKHTALYTAPPHRKPLAEEEIEHLDMATSGTVVDFVRAIERVHGIGGEE